MLNRYDQSAGVSTVENLESRNLLTASYDIGINVNDASSAMVGKATPIMKSLGVKTVRLWATVDDFNDRSIPNAMKRASDYSRAGFDVLMEINTRNGRVPSASSVKGWFDWAVKQPGVASSIDHWEIGNEVDSSHYWKGSLSQYVSNFLKPAYEALHAKGEEVVSAGPSWNPQDVQTMINHGLLNYTDYVGYHPYANSVSLVKQRIREINDVVDGRKPIAATEWNVRGLENNKTAWANAIKEVYPAIKAGFDLNYYFCFEVQNTPAGPAGILNTNGSLNQPFYNAFASFKNSGGSTGSDSGGSSNNGGSTPSGSGASISGVLFNDDDADGKYDSSEKATGSRTVFIDKDGDGKLDSGEKTTTSDAKGNFKFSGLTKGTYKVSRVFPGGYKLSNNDSGYVSVSVATSQQVKNVNIGTTDTGKTSTPSQPSSSSLTVSGIQLVDTKTKKVLGTYAKNAMVKLSSLPKNVSIQAIAGSATKSMVLSAMGKKVTENDAPYSFLGGGSWTPKKGNYTFGATAYSSDNAKGDRSSTAYISLTLY